MLKIAFMQTCRIANGCFILNEDKVKLEILSRVVCSKLKNPKTNLIFQDFNNLINIYSKPNIVLLFADSVGIS